MRRVHLAIPLLQVPPGFGPVVGPVAGNSGSQIKAGHTRYRLCFGNKADRVQICGRDDAVLGTLVPQVPGQRPGVDPLDTDNAMLLEIRVEAHGCTPVGIAILILLDNKTGKEQAATLDILRINTGITDLRIGHGYHLPLVGGVCEHLLIP